MVQFSLAGQRSSGVLHFRLGRASCSRWSLLARDPLDSRVRCLISEPTAPPLLLQTECHRSHSQSWARGGVEVSRKKCEAEPWHRSMLNSFLSLVSLTQSELNSNRSILAETVAARTTKQRKDTFRSSLGIVCLSHGGARVSPVTRWTRRSDSTRRPQRVQA